MEFDGLKRIHRKHFYSTFLSCYSFNFSECDWKLIEKERLFKNFKSLEIYANNGIRLKFKRISSLYIYYI